MKRFWIGISVLAVLLASGWAAAYFMDRCHRPISEELNEAAQIATEGPWEQAIALAGSAHSHWLECRDFTAAFADHSVIEEVDALFAEIKIYATARNTLSFSSTCARLAQVTKAVAESHHPKWQNLL